MEQTLTSTQLRVRLLGPPQVWQAENPVVIQRRKAQALLYYLAVTGKWHGRSSLASLLWPESDQTRAQASIRRNLSELNRTLGPGRLEIEQDTVRLADLTEHWVDVHEFRRLLAESQKFDPANGDDSVRYIELLTAAVSLYQTDFLAGFSLADAPAFDEWQSFQAEELRLLYSSALEQLAEPLCAQGKQEEAIVYARRRVNLDPLHEPAHRQLMRLYAATGQQAQALRQYQVCAQILESELDVPPAGETTNLYEQIRQATLTAPSQEIQYSRSVPTQTPAHNLPAALTPIVGRSVELVDLLALCQDQTRRLITILGPGGIGKTRLALEAATQLVAETSHGVYFVRLAQLSDPANIIPAIADALAMQFQADDRVPKQQLFAYLQQRHLFLVLDNFEHLMEGVPFIQDLLQSCPQVRLLVTSRERLKLTSETVFTLGNLDFPTGERSSQLQSYDAVKLFVETARRIRRTELLQDEDLRHVARICRMLGGMPLGIILAAAWIEVLSPAKIAAELAHGFDLLETELRDLPERQRNMRAILTYSWQQLTPAEQATFMRLAVLRGGFTLDAARAIAGASLPILARLIDKAFVQRTAGDRYDIHELLRQYAAQQLETAGVYPDAAQAHAVYYLSLLCHCEPRLADSQQQAAIREIEDAFENIRAAWQWAVVANDYVLVDRALDGLFRWFWLRRTRQHEGLELLRFAQKAWAPDADQIARPVWGRILARSIEQQGPWLLAPDLVEKQAETALEIARTHRNLAEEIFAQWVLGLATVSAHRSKGYATDFQPAFERFEACVAAYRAQGNCFWLAQTLEHLGHCLRQMDQFDRAILALQESLALRRAQGDRFGMARSLREIAWVRFKQGLESETLAAAQAAHALQNELGDQQGIMDSRFFLALSQLCCGDWPRAKELLDPVWHLAHETNNELYQRWATTALTVAMCMQENMRHLQSASCSFPNRFNCFTTTLMHIIFGLSEANISHGQNIRSYERNMRKLLELASTDDEMAACLPFVANLLSHSGNRQRAVMLLALAYRYNVISEGWIGLNPEMRALQQSLRDSLTPTEFAHAWQAGQRLDLQTIVTESLHANDQGNRAP